MLRCTSFYVRSSGWFISRLWNRFSSSSGGTGDGTTEDAQKVPQIQPYSVFVSARAKGVVFPGLVIIIIWWQFLSFGGGPVLYFHVFVYSCLFQPISRSSCSALALV